MTNKIAKKTIFLTLVTGLLLLLLFLPKPLLADAPSTSTEPTVPYDFRSDTFDILHTHIDADFSNFTTKNLIAHVRLDMIRKSAPAPLRIDLLKFTVDSLLLNGNRVMYTYDDSQIIVSSAYLAPVGDTFSVDVFYRGTPTQIPGDWGGFYWNTTYAFNIGVSFTENQHSFARCWIPCFDNFTERCTYSYAIQTDPSRRAVCGGMFVADSLLTPTGRISYWTLNTPIPSYLASVAVSDYAEVKSTLSGSLSPIPVSLFARSTDTTKLKNSFLHLPDALRIFENTFGPFKFPRIGYSVVPFSAGAMEHACNISYMQAAVDGTLSYESLMAHELSHNWFGNLVTCESASEMWLNEGWAKYCEYLFTEGLYGHEAYLKKVRDKHSEILQYLHTQEDYLALSGVPSEHTYGGTVYNKGADVIHTLRSYMGDSLFSALMTAYLDSFSFKPSNSFQLRDFLTRNGFPAKDFFDGWVLNPGFPHFSIDTWYWKSGTLYVYIRQMIKNAPAYFKNVPLELSIFHSDFTPITYTVNIKNQPCTIVEIPMADPPRYMALDFYEKISDAICDEKLITKSTGITVFNNARINLDINAITDSVLFRAEHHFVAPDLVREPFPYRINNYRFWTIDGIWDTNFKADIVFPFNASVVPAKINHLDTSFSFSSEDSLVLLYRSSPVSAWYPFDSFKIDNQTNKTDKIGKAIAYNIKPGQYALGVLDPLHPDGESGRLDVPGCIYIDMFSSRFPEIKHKIYPNPVHETLCIEGLETDEQIVKVCDLRGQKVPFHLLPGQTDCVDVHRLSGGMYILYYLRKNKEIQSLMFVKD